MEPVKVSTAADLAGLEPGAVWVLDVPGFDDPDHDPLAFAEAHRTTLAAVLAEKPAADDPADRFTVKELRKMATEHKIPGRSKLDEQGLIDALTAAGAL